MGALTTPHDLLWPTFEGPGELAAVERVPLSERGLPASTYELVTRAADLWPDRVAVSVLPDAEHFHTPFVRTFAELAGDVHRAAAALAGLGVRRGDAVAVVSVNCAEMLPLLLAAEAVGIYTPINPGLTLEHAVELVRLSGARVIVASGPELDPDVWAGANALAEATDARTLLALRPTAASDQPPALEPLSGIEVAYLDQRMATADGASLPDGPPAASDIASYLHTGGTTGTPKLAARTHANEVSNAWMTRASSVLDQDSVIFAALPLFHTNALLVTVLGPLLKGQHVVWAGLARLPRRPSVPELLEDRRALRDHGNVRCSDDLRGARAGSRRCRHLEPEVADRRGRAASARSGYRFRSTHRCQALPGLRADRGHMRQQPQLARRPASRDRRAAAALPAGATVRIDEATGEWTLPPGK